MKQKVEKDDIILITERGTDPIFSELIGSAVSSNNLKRTNQEFKQKSKDFDETFCGGKTKSNFQKRGHICKGGGSCGGDPAYTPLGTSAKF